MDSQRIRPDTLPPVCSIYGVSSPSCIRVTGARQHNLKNLSLEIPRDRLLVITGPSGSGKSSLAFDTLFAEGQRKYVESLSVYARQFLDQMEKPDVDRIDGLSPAIAIEQRTSGANPRSTIATTTEIYDFLRLLYANAGKAHDPETGTPMTHQTTSQIVDKLLLLPTRSRLMLLAPVVENQRGEFRDVLERLAREGFVRARVDGQIVELVAGKPPRLEPKASHSIDVVVDRLVIAEGMTQRLTDSVETALKCGSGRLLALHQPPAASTTEWTETLHSNRMYSPATGKSFDTPTPQHFSFNSPKGACPTCSGLGQKLVLDPALIVPDETKTLEDGAVQPYRRMGGKKMASYYKGLIKGVAVQYGAPLDRPWQELNPLFKEKLLHGTGDETVDFHFMRGGVPAKTAKPFEGVLPNLQRLFVESESEFTRNRLKAYMTLQPCDTCGGRRLKPEVLAITLGEETPPDASGSGTPRRVPGYSLADFCQLTIAGADAFLGRLVLDAFALKVTGEVLRELRARLGFLSEVGLGYLSLDR